MPVRRHDLPTPAHAAPDAAPGAEASTRPANTPRGGFIVHRRKAKGGRIATPPHRVMHEHGSLAEARAEAQRLSALHGAEFTVFQEVGAATSAGADAGEAA